jgi:hypothetical protein
MIAFHGMLVPAAKEAGIKVPIDVENYNAAEYMHWHVYCTAQLGESHPYAGCHWENAKVIANIPDDEIEKVTVMDLIEKGFAISFH